MAALCVQGVSLPDGEPVRLFADGDVWTDDPVKDAEVVPGEWVLPGLVDVHSHPGAHEPGDPFTEETLRTDLLHQLDRGVTLIRSPGLAGDPPSWFGEEPSLPRAVHAGPWLAQPGQFIDGWGERVSASEFPAVAAAQARRTGWAKIIADWGPDDPPLSVQALRAIVTAVHDVGGRVAVHSQHPDGGSAAVAAGVDSVEHGMCLSSDLLPAMAEKGVALTPTLNVLLQSLGDLRNRPDSPRKTWYLKGATVHPELVRSAHEAGVVILAGSDEPAGDIAAEIRQLVAAGLPPVDAIGAASWTARTFLGLPGLVPGAPADAVLYASDPRQELAALSEPAAVILRGRRVVPSASARDRY